MALELNTSDPLYSSLTYLFGVDDDNTIKEFVTGAEMTVDPAVLLPNSGTPSTTAPFGRSFRTAPDGTYNFKGVTFPTLPCPTNGKLSVFIVSNKFNAAGGARALFGWNGAGSSVGPGVQMTATQQFQPATTGGVSSLTQATTGSIGTGGHSWGFTRNGDTLVYAYIDGAVDANYATGISNSNGVFGYGSSNHTFGAIGGMAGQGHASLDNVYIAIFVGTELTATDFSRLHGSLTGDNAFALVNTEAVPPTQGTIDLTDPTFAFSRNNTELIVSTACTFHLHDASTGDLLASVEGATDASGVAGLVSNVAIAPSTLYRLDYKFVTGEYGVVYITSEP